MTLNHARCPVQDGVSRGNGGNVRPDACPGRRLPSSDPRSCPRRPRFSSLRPYRPALGLAGELAKSRSFAVPGGLTSPGPPWAGSGPVTRPLLGRKTRRGRYRWSVAPVSGWSLRWSAGRRRCPSWYRPHQVPRRGQEQGRGAGGGPAVRAPGARPAFGLWQARACRAPWPPDAPPVRLRFHDKRVIPRRAPGMPLPR